MTLRTLVIGTGSIGERHARCFQQTGRAEVGICEPNAELRQRIASTYHIRDSFDRLEAALAQSWDTAVIATPAPTHVPLAMSLVEAGIAPLIEKPLAVEVDGVADLVQAVNQRSLTTGVAYPTRAHSALRAMRDAIHANRFGKPLHLVVVGGQNFPTYRPAYREIYYTRHETGGGAVQDALTHLINAAEWLVGPMTAVVADAAHLSLPGVEVEDTVNVIARHGDVLGSYSLNQHQAPNETTLTVVCERGTARFERTAGAWRWMEKPETPWHQEPATAQSTDELFIAQANAWLDATEGSGPPTCTLDEGLQTLRAQRAVLASSRTRQWVEV